VCTGREGESIVFVTNKHKHPSIHTSVEGKSERVCTNPKKGEIENFTQKGNV
jgi:hypothetical protein